MESYVDVGDQAFKPGNIQRGGSNYDIRERNWQAGGRHHRRGDGLIEAAVVVGIDVDDPIGEARLAGAARTVVIEIVECLAGERCHREPRLEGLEVQSGTHACGASTSIPPKLPRHRIAP